MHNIRVQFTVPDVEKMVNLDVHANGEKRTIQFRVESIPLGTENRTSLDLVRKLRAKIKNYDSDWSLYHIGKPLDDIVPVTFKHVGA